MVDDDDLPSNITWAYLPGADDPATTKKEVSDAASMDAHVVVGGCLSSVRGHYRPY